MPGTKQQQEGVQRNVRSRTAQGNHPEVVDSRKHIEGGKCTYYRGAFEVQPLLTLHGTNIERFGIYIPTTQVRSVPEWEMVRSYKAGAGSRSFRN